MSRKIAPTILKELQESNKAFVDACSQEAEIGWSDSKMAAAMSKVIPKTPKAQGCVGLDGTQDPWEFEIDEARTKVDFDFLDPVAVAAAAPAAASPPKQPQRVVLGVDSDSEDDEDRAAKKAKKGLFKWCYFIENHPQHKTFNVEKQRWEPVKIVSKYKEYLVV